jgi:hypothetical protein
MKGIKEEHMFSACSVPVGVVLLILIEWIKFRHPGMSYPGWCRLLFFAWVVLGIVLFARDYYWTAHNAVAHWQKGEK